MTYEEAAQIAKERAKMDDWAEEHIDSPEWQEYKFERLRPEQQCNCSLCYWRRSHIRKILEENRDL